VNCWSCQVENPSGAKFCFNCGSRLVPEPATEAPCRSCGTPLPLDARFCGNCGTPDPVAPVAVAGSAESPAPGGLADLLEPGPKQDAAPASDGDAAALADDHEDDEATIMRSGLEESPMIPSSPGPKSRDRLNTEPAKVAVARTLAERLGRGAESPGAYSKQGPSLRKTDGKGKPPPPPAIGGAKPGGKGVAPGVRKADTEQSLPRTGLPKKTPDADGKRPKTLEPASKLPPAPSVAARSARPVAGARPTPAAASPTQPSASMTVPAPSRTAPGQPPASVPRATPSAAPASASMTVPAPSRPAPSDGPPSVPGARAAPSQPSTSMTVPAPSRTAPSPVPTSASLSLPPPKRPTGSMQPVGAGAPAEASRSKPRTITEPQKVVFGSATPSEVAEILAPPDGWPDITDELSEVRFSALQGVDEGVRAELEALRAKYPGHPEVETLAAELEVADDALALEEDSLELPVGVPRRTRPPVTSAPELVVMPVDGPPPLGRFPITHPPSSSPSQPPTARGAGIPRPAPLETSDELLDADGDGFDELDDPDAGDSLTDMTIVERVDLERLGVRDADELDEPEDDLADDLDEPDDPDFVDRTMMVPGLQAPAPYAAEPPPGAVAPMPAKRPAGERRPTLVPEISADDERRRSTLAPGFELPDDERGATLPPGSLVVGDDDPPTFAGVDDGIPPLLHDDPTPVPGGRGTLVPQLDGPPPPAPFSGLGGEAPPDGYMTAPDRDADTAAASGTFAVADLDLDDMPDLDGLPPGPDTDVDLYAASREDLDEDLELTQEGTVVSRAPRPPAPYGLGSAPVPVMPVRLVMLGARGEAVAERRIEPDAFLDVGRQAGEAWAEDRRMEPLHARLFPSPGGVVVDDFGLPSGVYTQILDTIAVEDGDEFKVGQARLALQRVTGHGWGQLTVVRHDAPEPVTILLDRDEIIIGRDEGDLTFPSDTFVSGDHCRFIREGNAVYLEDLGSSNGT
jgi:hypothetical protein